MLRGQLIRSLNAAKARLSKADNIHQVLIRLEISALKEAIHDLDDE